MGIGTSHNRECRSNSWRHSVHNEQISTNISDEQVQENVPRDVRENNEAESESDDKEVHIAEEVASTSRPLSEAKAKEMEEFRKHLAEKRQARKKILAERTNEMMDLKLQLEEERRIREELQNENKTLREAIADSKTSPADNLTEQGEDQKESSDLRLAIEEMENKLTDLHEQSRNIRKELAESNLSLQHTNTEMSLLNKENFELKNQIASLKDVNSASKQVLSIRETQLTQLKEKLAEIEKSLVDREMRTLSSDLRSEYERQLENIRNLRTLYEERARVAEVTRHNILKDLDDQKVVAEMQTKKCGELEEKITELEKELSDKNDIVGSTESQLGLSKAESKGLKAEMTVINQLISQMLLGYNNTQDLDKLLSKLEENHDLLADMVSREDCSDVASALPKLILDLVHQIDLSEPQTSEEQDEPEISSSDETMVGTSKTVTSGKEIVGNLPKVWRVLMELLSHQTGPPLIISEIHEKSSQNCYNSVDTPSGPRLVPSVSKTYIRLKDLIMEKKSLQKEMNRLKQLNSHLENRLQNQERRLGMVSSELGKTWHVVGRMQRQHQQLHTHEKILRYELQQKRLMLTKLKVELEYCREKWDMAKLKNSQTQVEWEKLRAEFRSRKLESTESPNNSAESGYSDNERPSDDDSIGSTDADKSERKRLKKKGKENIDKNDKINIGDQNQAANDSQNEDNESPVDVLSETEDQANMADTEDQSISESIKAETEPAADERDNTPVSEPSPTRSSGTCYNEVLAARSARLRKLEEQCYVLVQKVAKTSNKGEKLCTRLEQLHNQYGGGSTDEPSTSADQESCKTDVTASLADTTCSDSQLNGIDTSTETLTEINESTTVPSPESSLETEISQLTNVEDLNVTETINDKINDSQITDTDANVATAENIAVTEVLRTNEESEDIPGKAADEISLPSGSDQCTTTKPSYVQDYEARFAARDVRLKRMEEQAKSLVDRVSNTSTRSVKICTKLEELHSNYGKSEDDSTDSTLDSICDSQSIIASDEVISSSEVIADQTLSTPDLHDTADEVISSSEVIADLTPSTPEIHDTADEVISSSEVIADQTPSASEIKDTADKVISSSEVIADQTPSVSEIKDTADKVISSSEVIADQTPSGPEIQDTADKVISSSEVIADQTPSVSEIKDTADKVISSSEVIADQTPSGPEIQDTADKVISSSEVIADQTPSASEIKDTADKVISSSEVIADQTPSVSEIKDTADKVISSSEVIADQTPSGPEIQDTADKVISSSEVIADQTPSVSEIKDTADKVISSSEVIADQTPSGPEIQDTADKVISSSEVIADQTPSVSEIKDTANENPIADNQNNEENT